MNLSEWQQYSFKQRQKLLADIASAVKNGNMPVTQYTLVHRQARLLHSERDTIYQWARIERRRLRVASNDLAGAQVFQQLDHLITETALNKSPAFASP